MWRLWASILRWLLAEPATLSISPVARWDEQHWYSIIRRSPKPSNRIHKVYPNSYPVTEYLQPAQADWCGWEVCPDIILTSYGRIASTWDHPTQRPPDSKKIFILIERKQGIYYTLDYVEFSELWNLLIANIVNFITVSNLRETPHETKYKRYPIWCDDFTRPSLHNLRTFPAK